MKKLHVSFFNSYAYFSTYSKSFWSKADFYFSAMRDALELFDGGRSAGDAIIPFNQVANFARSFGWNPLDSTVAVLLGGGDEENPATKQDMQTKCISFEDLLPILWAISTGPDPGNFDDFMEAMRVRNISSFQTLTHDHLGI